MTAYQAAQKIAKALNEHFQIDHPLNKAAAWGREKCRTNGYTQCNAHAAVAMEGEYEWPMDFTGGDLSPQMTALWRELRAAGIYMEPGTGWMLDIYKEA